MKSVFVDFPYRKPKIKAVERFKQKQIRTQQSLDLSNNQNQIEKNILKGVKQQRLKTQFYEPYESMTNALLNRKQKEYQRVKRFSFNLQTYNNNHQIIQQQNKLIRSKILPSILPKDQIYNFKSQQQSQYRKNKNFKQPNKILDIMIDILKEQNKPNKLHKTVAAPIQSSFSGVKLTKKYKGPKVIENEILKHSNNLNVVRKKLNTEHKQKRQLNEPRIKLNSSSNNRFVSKRVSKQIEVWNTNVELLTFYPKTKQKNSFQDSICNEFLNDDEQ